MMLLGYVGARSPRPMRIKLSYDKKEIFWQDYG
jgi:hypothetical protein